MSSSSNEDLARKLLIKLMNRAFLDAELDGLSAEIYLQKFQVISMNEEGESPLNLVIIHHQEIQDKWSKVSDLMSSNLPTLIQFIGAEHFSNSNILIKISCEKLKGNDQEEYLQ